MISYIDRVDCRYFGFIARPLYLLLPQSIGFLQPSLQLFLHSQADFKRDGGDRFYENLANLSVDLRSGNNLAEWFTMLDTFALTRIVWN
jgi:hypothetical protein